MSGDTYDELLRLGNEVYDKAIEAAGMEWDRAHPTNGGGGQFDDPTWAGKKQAAEEKAQADYADIPEHFTRFADSLAQPPAIGQLKTVAGVLNQSAAHSIGAVMSGPISSPAWLSVPLGRMESKANKRLRHWSGNAANEFDENFLSAIGDVRERQGWLAAFLAATLQAHQNIRKQVHDDVVAIGNAAKQALDEIIRGRSTDVHTKLSVFTAIVSVLLAIPTDGISLGLEGVIHRCARQRGTRRRERLFHDRRRGRGRRSGVVDAGLHAPGHQRYSRPGRRPRLDVAEGFRSARQAPCRVRDPDAERRHAVEPCRCRAREARVHRRLTDADGPAPEQAPGRRALGRALQRPGTHEGAGPWCRGVSCRRRPRPAGPR